MEGTFSVGCMIFSKNIKVWPNIGCWWKSIPGIVGGRRLAGEIPGLSQQRGTTAKSAKKQTYQIVFSRKYSVIISCSKPFLFLGQKSKNNIDWTGLENKVFTNRGFIHFDLDSGLCQQITTASSSRFWLVDFGRWLIWWELWLYLGIPGGEWWQDGVGLARRHFSRTDPIVR